MQGNDRPNHEATGRRGSRIRLKFKPCCRKTDDGWSTRFALGPAWGMEVSHVCPLHCITP